MNQFTALGSLGDPVRRQVYEYVAAHDDPVGREQTATDTGLPLHTVRFHLERLVEEGLLETDFRRLSGRTGPGAGRPAKLYCRAAAEVSASVPPRNYDLVGSVLAAAVVSSLAGAPLEQALSEAASSRGREAGVAFGRTGDGLERIRGLMEREGFEPTVEDDDLTLRNCPFDALAKEQPDLVCGVNLDYVNGALDGLGCSGLRARLEPAQDRCCVRVGHDGDHEQRSRRTTDRAR